MRALYETKNEELDRKVKELKNDSIDKKRPDFNEALKLALNFLGTPAETWKKPNRNLKIMIHKMIFQENPKYSLKTGFGTPKLSLLFSVKQHILGNNDHLVELGRVALPSRILPVY